MEFRLLYEGNLPPSANRPRPREKHAIRRAFHPQLRRLWSVRPNLRSYADRVFCESIESRPKPAVPETPEERFQIGLKELGRRYAKAGYELVPIVVPEFALQCSIDILLLRPEQNEVLGEWGDIDGQVKTVLDALRIPDATQETGEAKPEEDEHPLFCLLQDDKLISEVKITADKLLMLPALPKAELQKRNEATGILNLLLEDQHCKWNFSQDEKTALSLAREALRSRGETTPNDAFVVVHVRLNHRDARTFDNYFG